jgi:hypothetical protein
MRDKLIMDYVSEERNRCILLCEALTKGVWFADREFLIHCIEYSVQPNEVEARRKRYAEFPSVAADVDPEIEDLM